MRFLISLVLSILLISAPFGAEAQDSAESAWTKSVTSSISDRYAFRKSGFIAYDGPVIQTDLSFSKDDWTLSVWNSTALSEPGTYGNRGAGDEIDFCGTKESSLWGFSLEASACYWLSADFGSGTNDIVQLYVQAGRPFTFENVTVTPYVRLTQWVGIGTYPDTSFVDPGASVSIALTERLSLDVDASYSRDVTFNIPILNASIGASYAIAPGWTVFGSFQAAQRMKPAVTVGITIGNEVIASL